MGDHDYNSAMDVAIEVIREQQRCVTNTCCAAHLRMIIRDLEEKKVKNKPAETLMQDHYRL